MRLSFLGFSGIVAYTLAGVMSTNASAQPLGVFRWQQEPYCNVITVNIVSAGPVFQLDGTDDQCGAQTAASVSGLAFINPNGSVGIGLTIVTTPGGAPEHIDAAISVATVSGTWRDNAGSNGAWTLRPGSSSGGAPRPVVRPVFVQGLSAGGASIGNVAAPSAPADAANKEYVDATRTYANGLASAGTPLSGYSTVTLNGLHFNSSSWGCKILDPSGGGQIATDLAIPVGAKLVGIRVKYGLFGAGGFLSFKVYAVDFVNGSATQQVVLEFQGSGTGARVETRSLDQPPVSASRTYYMTVVSGSTTGQINFCGVEPLFTRP